MANLTGVCIRRRTRPCELVQHMSTQRYVRATHIQRINKNFKIENP